MRTRAERDGDDYVVNGQKVWMSLGDHADWLFVLVRTNPDPAAPKHRGITFLMVDVATPGVTVRPIEDLRGAAPFAEVFFEDARVPVANRIGDENRGFYVAMDTLTFERSGIGAVIKYEQVLRDLVAFVQAEPPALRPDWRTAVRDELAQRYVEVRVLYDLARVTISQELSAEDGRETAVGYEASANQLFSAELHQRLARTGAKVLGLQAQRWAREGAPMGALFTHLGLDAVAATFLAGTSEIQRNVVATRGLGLPRS
ncbi:MAG: acyl-CoA dehydrogenase family protein [Myxococcota bacterium]